VPGKRKYCNLSQTFHIDKEKLLHEAQLWPNDKDVNWSKLARDYGLMSSNGGQMIKEFLEENNIPAASIYQRPTTSKKTLYTLVHGKVHFYISERSCLKNMNVLELYVTLAMKTLTIFLLKIWFYGDGPAAQFEAGYKQGGGHYCCVGCGADHGRFSDIAYCYRPPKPSLK
jgi:hypothetical protein